MLAASTYDRYSAFRSYWQLHWIPASYTRYQLKQPTGAEPATHMSEQLVQGADHTPHTTLIAQALQAKQKALRIHKKPQEEIPTYDMMSEIVSSL